MGKDILAAVAGYVSLVLSLVAAIVGGYLCKAIAGNETAVRMLAASALVLGLVIAIGQMTAERPGDVRPAELSVMEPPPSHTSRVGSAS